MINKMHNLRSAAEEIMDVNLQSSEERKLWLSKSDEKNEAPPSSFQQTWTIKASDLNYEVSSYSKSL